MTEAHFRKYHGLGNDYLVIDPNVYEVDLTPDAIRLICHRNFGIGADGILYGPLEAGENPRVKIFNPDGSEAEKSGNGLRIFARYLYEKKYVEETHFRIETLGGPVEAYIQDDAGNRIKIKMGTITFRNTDIPVRGSERDVVDEELDINGTKYRVTCLSIGNPHCVIPMEEISKEKARELGPFVENHRLFPNRINMQLLKVLDRANIEIQIWERGAGYTLASGSSSCAAAGAAHRLGLVDNEVNVRMPGGTLLVEFSENKQVYLTGEVEGVFEGTFHTDLREKIEKRKEPWPRLRPAKNSDRKATARLVFGVLKEYGLKPDPASTDADLEDIESSYFKRGGTFLVLEEKDGSIIGAYGLYPMKDQTCELRKMYLQKAYRGKGLGKFLMEDALARARQLGFEKMVLETASVLKEAIALYKTYGFVEYTPDHLSSRCDQAYVIELR
jgi:diaminopimelate epimerase